MRGRKEEKEEVVEEERITVTDVKQLYKLTEKDLEDVDYFSKRNPMYRNAAPMRLYLLSDIKELHASKQNLLSQEVDNSKSTRLKSLEKLHKIKVENVPEKFRKIIFEDFLDNIKRPKILIGTIKKNYHAFKLLNTLPENLRKESLLSYFVMFGEVNKSHVGEVNKSHVGEVNNPFKIIKKAFKHSNNMQTVFSNLSPLIFSFLDSVSTDRFIATFSQFSFVKQIDEYRDPANIENNITYQINRKFSEIPVGKQKALKYFVHFAQMHPNFQESVIKDITLVLETTNEQREKLLKNKLKEYHINLRKDSKIGESFISSGCPSMSEVVAKIRITSYLFSYDHVVWSNNHDVFEELLFKYVREGLTFEQSTDKVIARKPRVSHREWW